MAFYQEFRAFISRGNILDFAIGLIIGAAFGKIISSFVADILMPPIGLLLGGVNFSSLAYVLKPASSEHPAVSINYGLFINTIIDFLIISLAIFCLVKIINKLRSENPAQVSTKTCPECQMPVPILATRCGHCTVIYN